MFLDRGFLAVANFLEEEFNLHPKMPCFLNKNQKQFKSWQANESRMFTKIRWFIEATNSLFKQKFRAHDATVQNKALPHYAIDFRIAVSLIKKCCDRLKSDVGNKETVASNMLACHDKIPLYIFYFPLYIFFFILLFDHYNFF